jgi:hypothetical protein
MTLTSFLSSFLQYPERRTVRRRRPILPHWDQLRAHHRQHLSIELSTGYESRNAMKHQSNYLCCIQFLHTMYTLS